jgi:hypothetical protein
LKIGSVPKNVSIDFWIKLVTVMNVTIDDSYGYKLINQTKAETIIKDVANRLT